MSPGIFRAVNYRYGLIASCLACLSIYPGIGLASNLYYLAPVINGHPGHGVLPVEPSHGGYIVSEKALKQAGLSPRLGKAHGKGYRYIKGNARLKLKVDMKTQTIYFSLPMNLENRSKIDLQHIGFLSSRPNGYSASVSYNLDLTHDYAGNHQFSGTSFEGNLTGYMFTPFGSIRNSEQFYYQTFKGISQPNAIRLGTTYEYDQPNVPRSFYAGDIITPSTGWSRGVFMGGVMVASNYALQPNAITFPTPTINGTVADPSSVSLLVNNATAYQNNRNAGPFSIVGIPVLNGVNSVTVSTRDASGHVVTQTTSFYVSPTTLRDGLTTYSFAAGYLRFNYGTARDGYAVPAFQATVSHGFNGFTMTGHTEASPRLGLAGASFETTGYVGDFTVAGAASDSRRGTGWLASANLSRSGRIFNFNIGAVATGPHYRDLATEAGQPYPSLSWHASFGLTLPWNAGSFSVAYDDEQFRHGSNSAFLIGSYYRNLWANWTMTASAFEGMSSFSHQPVQRSFGATLTLSIPIGGGFNTDASINAGSDAIPSFGNDFSYSNGGLTGLSVQAQNQTGAYPYRYVQATETTQHGQISGAVRQFSGALSTDISARGAIVAYGGLHMTRPTGHSFALLKVGYPHVRVDLQNQPIGKTDSKGDIFIADPLPRQKNVVSIDPRDIPITTNITNTKIDFVPPLYGGVTASIHARKNEMVLLHIIRNGKPVAVGDLLYINNKNKPIVIGYSGAALVPNPTGVVSGRVVSRNWTCHFTKNVQTTQRTYLIGVDVPCR